MGVMEVNRKGWTAQCMDITGRSLQGDGKEGEEAVHAALQAPQRALTMVVCHPRGINNLWLQVKRNGRT